MRGCSRDTRPTTYIRCDPLRIISPKQTISRDETLILVEVTIARPCLTKILESIGESRFPLEALTFFLLIRYGSHVYQPSGL
jgi:hypothetical protein